MKTLHQSLIDYELGQLQAIAHCRAVPLDTSVQAEAVALLAEALLSPAALAIALSDLSEAEQEALQLLLENEGQIEGPRFSRQYGVIRAMGPARLARERPWENPVTPAEGLWYRGLTFKAFEITAQGHLEIVYIPRDLLALLRLSENAANIQQQPAEPEAKTAAAGTGPGQPLLQLAQIPAPASIISRPDRLRENIFSLLIYLQTRPVRLQKNGQPTTKDREALANCLLEPLLPTFPLQAELEFLLHLGRRAGLLVVKHGRLRPDPDPTRAWLQAHPGRQRQQLQKAWQADPTWNDLWHTPGLVPQPTGWENSPLLARSKILGYLAQLEAGPKAWYGLDDFVAAIKKIDPDFQRPDGDYDSWYIQDRQGNYLMGFENWDRVEGALIRHFLTHLLPLLGVVALGRPAEESAPAGFRISPPGAAFLTNQPFQPPSADKPRLLRVTGDYRAYVSPGASLYDRFQLARFANLERRDAGQVVYQISQASVGYAMRNGVTADQIVAFLGRATNNRVPLKVVETLRTWGRRRETVQIERATLLRLKAPELAAELRQHPTLGPLLGEQLGPTTILILPDHVAAARRLLVELGYLEE